MTLLTSFMRSLNFPHNPRIDEIRCLAASLVFFFHFHQYFIKPDLSRLGSGEWNWFSLFTEGHTGVGLFFTLSGFLFMQIALHHKRIVYRDF
ncbi:MAG TPA: acyltransferase family protein, partial [Noviherbaspirillum sp.]